MVWRADQTKEMPDWSVRPDEVENPQLTAQKMVWYFH